MRTYGRPWEPRSAAAVTRGTMTQSSLPARPLPRLLSALALGLATTPASAQDLFDLPFYIELASEGEMRALGDFNGDDRIDALHMTRTYAIAGGFYWSDMRVLLNAGAPSFTPGPALTFPYPVGFDPKTAELDPLVGDFDGDGLLDVAADEQSTAAGLAPWGVRLFWGDGAGGLTKGTYLEFHGPVEAVHAGQLDADPELELFLKVREGVERSLLWADWNGAGFDVSSALLVSSLEIPNGTRFHAVIDIEGDGVDDGLAISTDGDELRHYPTVGGAPTHGPTWPLPAAMHGSGTRLVAADLDGDGDTDAAVAATSLDPDGVWVKVFENAGGGLVPHAEQLVETVEAGWGSLYTAGVHAADWDGDGWAELFSNNGVLAVLRANGDWTFSEGLSEESTGSSGAGVADIDGNGTADFVAGATLHLGTQDFEASPVVETGAWFGDLEDMRPLDQEGDGDLDVGAGEYGDRFRNDATGALDFENPVFPSPPVARPSATSSGAPRWPTATSTGTDGTTT